MYNQRDHECMRPEVLMVKLLDDGLCQVTGGSLRYRRTCVRVLRLPRLDAGRYQTMAAVVTRSCSPL